MTSQGNRNNALFKVAVNLAWDGESASEILRIAQRFNRRNCEPPLEDSEVRATVESAVAHQTESSRRAPLTWIPRSIRRAGEIS